MKQRNTERGLGKLPKDEIDTPKLGLDTRIVQDCNKKTPASPKPGDMYVDEECNINFYTVEGEWEKLNSGLEDQIVSKAEEMNLKTQMKETIQKTREYLDYIERHYDNVQKAWKEIKEKCKHLEILKDENNVAFLDNEVLQHDLSKLSEVEFVEYRKVFYPTSKERKGYMDEGWKHHMFCNPHHWENWTKKRCPLVYLHCIHMIVDWTAMSYELGGTAQKYYELNQHVINIPEEYDSFLYEIFDCMG